MFQGLRQQGILYILESSDEGLSLKIGQVISVSNPTPKYSHFGTTPAFGTQPEMVVDVKVKVGDEEMEFKQLAATQSIANSGNVVVSDSREAMDAEVDGRMHTSKAHLDSVPYHEKVLNTGEFVKRELNPQFAKEKAQEEKIDALEGRMGGIEDTLSVMMGMLSDTLNKSNFKKRE